MAMHYDLRMTAGNGGDIVRYATVVAALCGKRNKAAVEGNRDAIDGNET
jgi:hypothetical protein